MSDRPVRNSILDANCLDDLDYWAQTDRRKVKKILSLMKDILKNPFRGRGRGKPELLRGSSGKRSRHIDHEHRLVYIVKADSVYFLTARYHYDS